MTHEEIEDIYYQVTMLEDQLSQIQGLEKNTKPKMGEIGE